MTAEATKLWYMKKINIFDELPHEKIQELSKLTRMQDVPARQTIYFPGDTADQIFLLKKGRVRLVRSNVEGEQLTLAIVEQGEIFGEMALTEEGERQSRAETLEDSFICSIPRQRFVEFLKENPELNFRVTSKIGERRREIEMKVENLLFRDGRGRLLHVLSDLFENHFPDTSGSGDPTIPFSHQEIANLTGLTRPTVSKFLNEFADEGMIELGRQELTLRDPQKLKREATAVE